MKQGKTNSGFEFEVDENAINDMEIIDAFVEIQDGNPAAYNTVVKKLFTPEQKKALYDHVRTDGRVPLDKLAVEINDVLSLLGEPAKN